jgi:hypothetical protein
MLAFILSLTLSSVSTFPLNSTAGLESINANLDSAVYRGKPSVVMTEDLDPTNGDLAIFKGLDFHNGTIDFDVAGLKTSNAPRDARSFVGIAFRGTDDMRRYENFYLRMTNGRAADPSLRKHAVQYCSPPDYTWDLLRKKVPGKFEAYSDLEVGAWKHIRIWVHGTEAKFFVGDMKTPALVVHGLLMGDVHGKVALWVAGYTKAYFSNLRVRAA